MKTAVITGGNSGIGKAAAIALAKKGYRVIIHGRDPQKTLDAQEEIKRNSGSNRVEHVLADVATLQGMKTLGQAIKHKAGSIEALVLSTGIILPGHIITPDNLEKGFSVQYLSRFAVTQMLMPELLNGNARIVHVAAPVMRGAKIYLDDLSLKNNFTMLRAMGQEMFANHLFVQEFAKRHPVNDVRMNIMHVGLAKTGIMRHSNFLLRAGMSLFGKSPEQAAKNAVFLASDDSVNFSGYFLKKPGKPQIREKEAFDPGLAEKLWEKSMELIKPLL